jgi:hypothetical protein
MTVAIATVTVFGNPDRTGNGWMSWGVLIPLLVVVLTVMALSERSEAATCGGTPLIVAEATLPVLTPPA